LSHSRLVSGLLGLVILACLGLSSPAGAFPQGQPWSWAGVCPESDRFGVAVAGAGIEDYDVGQLHAGWYHSFALLASAPHPGGMGYVQTVRISDDGPFEDRACSACPTWNTVQAIALANPGSLWVIGNEPDRQDYTRAGRYAEIYHDFYAFLKAVDPTCQIAVGGVVQPTPIRLQYLDMIRNAYQVRYGGPLPVDVWNVHNYVLREGATGWGCGIPPDTDPNLAIEYGIQDHDNVTAWAWHLRLMRTWMQLRGYRDRPLIITEYGILMPEIYGYDYDRVRQFFLATANWLTNATDPDIGYPADGNRLVQGWAWYSLNDPAFEGFTSWNHLFDPETLSITPLGLDYAAYTAPLTTPSVDLQPTALLRDASAPGPGGLVSARVMARIYNAGSGTADAVTIHFERDGAPAGDATIASIGAYEVQVASMVWTGLLPGHTYQATVTVDPYNQLDECDAANNSLSASFLIGDQWSYLPLIQKRR
jgi:hypothetical protein